MALTHTQAKVLGILAVLDAAQARTVRQVSDETGLSASAARKALRCLQYSGLVIGTRQSPPNWRCTNRGRQLSRCSGYRDTVDLVS